RQSAAATALWNAPPTVAETLVSCVPRLQNPKRRGPSLPAALQKRWRAPPTALLQTLPLQHVRRFGLRRQSAAATALWIVPRRLRKHWPHTIHAARVQNCVALRFSPHVTNGSAITKQP